MTNRNQYNGHGMRNTSEYESWRGAKARCRRVTHARYEDYGGRGITFCSRWDTFDQFYYDMGDKPTPSHSLERADNSKGYSPCNCYWATPAQQKANQRVRKDSKGITGIYRVTKSKLWQVRFNGKHIGCTPDFFEACCMRKSAELT